MPEPLATAFGRLLHEPALPVETLFEIVALLLSPLPKVAWFTRAE